MLYPVICLDRITLCNLFFSICVCGYMYMSGARRECDAVSLTGRNEEQPASFLAVIRWLLCFECYVKLLMMSSFGSQFHTRWMHYMHFAPETNIWTRVVAGFDTVFYVFEDVLTTLHVTLTCDFTAEQTEIPDVGVKPVFGMWCIQRESHESLSVDLRARGSNASGFQTAQWVRFSNCVYYTQLVSGCKYHIKPPLYFICLGDVRVWGLVHYSHH